MVIKYVDSALSNKSGNWRVIAQDVRTTPGFEDFSKEVIGVGEYSARGCFMGGENDIVIINAKPDKNWAEWERHLKNAGLPLSQIIYSENGEPKLQGVEGYEYLPFFPSERTKKIAESSGLVYIGDPEVSQRFNNKQTLKGFCDELNLLRIPGSLYTAGEGETKLNELIFEQFEESKTGNVFLRNPVGASGIDLYIVNPTNLNEVITKLKNNCGLNKEYMVEPGLDFGKGSPCSTFYIKQNGGISILPFADQVLNNNVHGGNNVISEHKPNCKILEKTKIIAKGLASKGYTGFGGIDYGITPKGDVYVVELNGRTNANNYVIEAAGKLKRNELKFLGIRAFGGLEKRSFNDSLEMLGDSILTPYSSSGVIIPIPRLSEQGKIMLYGFAESKNDLNEIFSEAREKLKR